MAKINNFISNSIKNRDIFFWYFMSILLLTIPIYLSKQLGDVDVFILKEFLIIFSINSVLLIFSHSVAPKVASLTLIFIYTIEIMITVFYFFVMWNSKFLGG